MGARPDLADFIWPDAAQSRQPSSFSGPSQYWIDRGLQFLSLGNGLMWTRERGWQTAASQVGPPKYVNTPKGLAQGFGTTSGTGATDRIEGPTIKLATGFRSIVDFSFANGSGGGGIGRIFQTGGTSGVSSGDEAFYTSTPGTAERLYGRITPALTGQWIISGAPVTGVEVMYAMSHDQRTIGQTPIFYKNGARVTTTTSAASTGSYVTGEYSLDIGNRRTDGGRNWDGWRSILGIFDHPSEGITDAEVSSLYADRWQLTAPSNTFAFQAASAGISPPLTGSTNTSFAPTVSGGPISPALTGSTNVSFSPTVGLAAISPALTGSTNVSFAPNLYTQVVFFDDHERSNINIPASSIAQDVYAPTVSIYPRLHTSDTYPPNAAYEYFHLRTTGMLGKRPNFKVRYYLTANTTNLDAWGFQAAMRPMYSYDAVTWNYFDTWALSADALNIDFKLNADFTGDTVWIASQRPFTNAMIATQVTYLSTTFPAYVSMPPSSAGNNYVANTMDPQTDERGRVIPSQPIYSMRLTDLTQNPVNGSKKRVVILIACAHGSEDVGNWQLKGALEWLCSADTKAADARRNFDFYVYPAQNPMGRAGGHWRGDFNLVNPGYDPNRRWVAVPGMECVTKNKAAITLDLGTKQTSVWLDYHGGYSGFFMYSGSPLWTNFQAKMLTYHAGITIFGDNPVNSAAYYGRNTLGALLSTIVESSRDQILTEAQIQNYGASSLKSLQDLYADGLFPPVELSPPLTASTNQSFAPTVSGASSISPPLTNSTNVSFSPTVGNGVTYTLAADSGSFSLTGQATNLVYTPVSLPTVARPVSDTSNTGWLASTGVALYAMIDEVIADDADYIYTTNATSVCQMVLNTTAYPGTTSQIFSFRASSANANTVQARLRNANNSIVATWPQALTATPTTYQKTLTAGEIALITSGTLSLELTAL